MAKRKNKRRIPNAALTREQLNQEFGLPPNARWVKLRSIRQSPIAPPQGLPHYDAWMHEINLASKEALEEPAFSHGQYEDVYPYFYTLNAPVYAAPYRTIDEVQSEYLLPLIRGHYEYSALMSMTPYLDLYGYDPDPNYTVRFEPVRERATGFPFSDPYAPDNSQLLASQPTLLERYQAILGNTAPNFSKLSNSHEKFSLAMLPTYEIINDDLYSRFQASERENRRREESRLREILLTRLGRTRLAEMLRQRGDILSATQIARQEWDDALFRNNNPKRKKRRGKKKK